VSSTAQAATQPGGGRGGLRHQLRILRVIAGTEYKLKYQGSALGYVWSVIKPLALFSLLYVVFGRLFNLVDISEYYPHALLMGIVVFSFFADATSLGMTSIVTNQSLVRRLSFPRAIVPISATLTSAITFGVNSLVVAGFIAWRGITPRLDWLLLVPLLLELYLVVVGVSLILATVFVFLRDIGQVWELVIQLLFYASPFIYPIGFLPPWARDIAFLSPLTQIIQDLRAVVLYPDLPSNKITAADALALGHLLPIAIAVCIFVGGLLLFRRHEGKFAERV
jgi:ABC-2 type transport system permease protein